MKITARLDYKNGEGFITAIVKPPKTNPADIIALMTVKGKKKTIDYYTPDEAMGVAIGLLRAVDYLLNSNYKNFRKKYFKRR